MMYERYRKLRDLRGWRDSDLANRLSITASTFSDWKRGKSNPNVDKLVKIARELGTTVEYLYDGNDSRQSAYPELSPASLAVISAYNKADYIHQEMVKEILGIRTDQEKEGDLSIASND